MADDNANHASVVRRIDSSQSSFRALPSPVRVISKNVWFASRLSFHSIMRYPTDPARALRKACTCNPAAALRAAGYAFITVPSFWQTPERPTSHYCTPGASSSLRDDRRLGARRRNPPPIAPAVRKTTAQSMMSDSSTRQFSALPKHPSSRYPAESYHQNACFYRPAYSQATACFLPGRSPYTNPSKRSDKGLFSALSVQENR